MKARFTARLAGVALLAAGGLGLLFEGARPAVDSSKSAEEATMRAVLPEAGCGVFVRSVFTKGEADTFVYYRGYRNPDTTGLVGYTVRARGRGYSSSIETIAGVGLDGRVRGIKITSQKETPGSGAKIAEVKPSKTFSDALKATGGKTSSGKVIIAFGGPLGSETCLEIQVKDTTLCAAMEKAVARRDTAAIIDAVPKVLDLGAQHDSLLRDRAAAVEVAEKLVGRIREGQIPWWQAQFIGKASGELVLTKDKAAKAIQGITGATVSTRAVTESVRNAIVQLELALGGFKEAKQ